MTRGICQRGPGAIGCVWEQVNMQGRMRHAVQRLATQAERVTALVLGAVMPRREFDDMLEELERASVARWRVLVGGTLGALFVLALAAAWVGPIGLGLYFLAAFVLLR